MSTLNDIEKGILIEITTDIVKGLIENDRKNALSFFKGICTIKALECFGVELTESEKEEYKNE